MLRDFQPHTMSEIIAHFADGAHDDELEQAHFCAPEIRGTIRDDDVFYVMPDCDYDGDLEAEEFAQ
jgi:hypothetical protein